MRNYGNWLIALFGSSALIAPGVATAADARLEELVVTARKTEENILKVPMSISACGMQPCAIACDSPRASAAQKMAGSEEQHWMTLVFDNGIKDLTHCRVRRGVLRQVCVNRR